MLPSQPTPIHQTGQSVSHNPQYQFLVILGTISKPTSDKKVKVYAYLVFLQVLLVLPSLWIVGFAMSFPQVLLTRLFARSSVVLCRVARSDLNSTEAYFATKNSTKNGPKMT